MTAVRLETLEVGTAFRFPESREKAVLREKGPGRCMIEYTETRPGVATERMFTATEITKDGEKVTKQVTVKLTRALLSPCAGGARVIPEVLV